MTSCSSHHTRWSLVQAAKGDTPQGRAALAELCEIYYRPIEGQMRRWISDPDEAGEMTQAFFARLLSGSQLAGAESTRGRFRNYLFASARHFLINERRAQQATKRGAAVTETADTLDEEFADAAQVQPDVEFDRAWACALIHRALSGLEAELVSAGKAGTWTVLKPWLSGTAKHGETSAAAQRLGISETAVRVQLSRLRQRLRSHLEQQIADTLSPEADPQAELRHLLALWG
jgi:RNA polymerase sigma-70 factor (ECF subfamily)